MKKLLLTALMCFFTISTISSQEIIEVDTRFAHNSSNIEKVIAFTASKEAKKALEWVMSYTGLKANFIIKSANVSNAEAALRGSNRYIFYNKNWLEELAIDTGTDWSKISVLAHEIGHHLNGHTLLGTGSYHKIELEADEFSGFVLYRMGASIQDAKAAMKAISNIYGSDTHPPRRQRLNSISKGWYDAKKLIKQNPLRESGNTSPESDIFLKIKSTDRPTMVMARKYEGDKSGYLTLGLTVDLGFSGDNLAGGDLLIWVERQNSTGKWIKLRDENNIYYDKSGYVLFGRSNINPSYGNRNYEQSYSFPIDELHLPEGKNKLRINAKYCVNSNCINFPYDFIRLKAKIKKWGIHYRFMD